MAEKHVDCGLEEPTLTACEPGPGGDGKGIDDGGMNR